MIHPNVTQTLTGNAKTGTSIRVFFLCFQRFKETRSLHFHKMHSKGIGENSPTSHFAGSWEMSIAVMICPACRFCPDIGIIIVIPRNILSRKILKTLDF